MESPAFVSSELGGCGPNSPDLNRALLPLQNYSKGNTLRVGVKYTGVGKYAVFDRNRPLHRKRYDIRIYRHIADRSVSVPMTFSDLEGRDARGQNFLADFHKTLLCCDLE